MNTEETLSIFESILCLKRFNNIQALVFQYAWQGESYAEIAEKHSYDAEYIKQVGAQVWQILSQELGQRVSKSNCRAILRRYAHRNNFNSSRSPQAENVRRESNPESPSGDRVREEIEIEPISSYIPIASSAYQDWREAVDVNSFYGREKELALLSRWVQSDRCRLVAILGMGGMGKTVLCLELAQHVRYTFDYAIWLSLRDAPPVEETLSKLIDFFSHQRKACPVSYEQACPTSLAEKISCLMTYLREARCFIVLDNFEAVLRDTAGDRTTRFVGHYRDGYEGYGQSIERIGESSHQSCLILTSREAPRQLTYMQGPKVRSLFLQGLEASAGKAIFQELDEFRGSDAEWQQSIAHYAGNPLALKIVASTVRNFFDCNISQAIACLHNRASVFDGIRDLLDRQFERLCELETEVMFCLAIEREATSIDVLQATLFPSQEIPEIVNILDSLQRRSLLEKDPSGFTLHPFVMEYTIARLIARLCDEICNPSELNVSRSFATLGSYALPPATASNYVRDSQAELILDPLISNAIARLGSKQALLDRLNQILPQLSSQASDRPDCTIKNILNLMRYLQIEPSGHEFSYYTIRQAHLKSENIGDKVPIADRTSTIFLSKGMARSRIPEHNFMQTGSFLNKGTT